MPYPVLSLSPRLFNAIPWIGAGRRLVVQFIWPVPDSPPRYLWTDRFQFFEIPAEQSAAQFLVCGTDPASDPELFFLRPEHAVSYNGEEFSVTLLDGEDVPRDLVFTAPTRTRLSAWADVLQAVDSNHSVILEVTKDEETSGTLWKPSVGYPRTNDTAVPLVMAGSEPTPRFLTPEIFARRDVALTNVNPVGLDFPEPDLWCF